MSYRVLLRIIFGSLFILLVIGSCFPSLNWPHNRDRILAPVIDKISSAQDKENRRGWQTSQEVQSLLRDYVIAVNTIDAHYHEPVHLSDLHDSTLAAIEEAVREGEHDPAHLLEIGNDGLFHHLDRYSTYLDAKAYRSYHQGSRNQLSGVGIRIESAENGLRILYFYPDSDLADRDIMIGSIITSADGVALKDLKLHEAIALVKGEPGTTVTLEIEHDGHARTFTVERRLIELTPVTLEKIEDQEQTYLLFKINNFNERSSDTFKELLEDTLESDTQDVKGLLIDLRYNPGGHVGEVIKMVDWLLERGTILRISYREDETHFKAYRSDLVDASLPIVVLINRASASASEIFAGTLQSAHRATVVGETSFGKTLVQRTFSLSEGRGFKLTIGRYYVYDDVLLSDGVAPDVAAVDDPEKSGDEILMAALALLAEHASLQP